MMTLRYFCEYHDIILCERHKGECFGGERCELVEDTESTGALRSSIACSVCDGILKPKAAR